MSRRQVGALLVGLVENDSHYHLGRGFQGSVGSGVGRVVEAGFWGSVARCGTVEMVCELAEAGVFLRAHSIFGARPPSIQILHTQLNFCPLSSHVWDLDQI